MQQLPGEVDMKEPTAPVLFHFQFKIYMEEKLVLNILLFSYSISFICHFQIILFFAKFITNVVLVIAKPNILK